MAAAWMQPWLWQTASSALTWALPDVLQVGVGSAPASLLCALGAFGVMCLMAGFDVAYTSWAARGGLLAGHFS
jgi:hypothetical protein